MDIHKNDKKLIIVAIFIICLYMSPLFVLGQNAHVVILDNLDGAVASLKVLAEGGQVFGGLHSTVPAMMNGLPRNVFGTEFNLQVLLYWAFPPFIAYVINLLLIHLVAFAGMYLLLKAHILPQPEDRPIVIGVAMLFALLPFWPYGGLSVAGQPLVLYAFMNIRNHIDNLKDWVILLLVPFYSSLVFSFAFFLCVMGIWWLYEALIKKRINLRFLVSIAFMGLVFLGVEYRLIYMSFFDTSFVSIRSEFPLSRNLDFIAALKTAVKNFLFGQFHVPTFQHLFILPAVFLALILGLAKKIPMRPLMTLLVITGVISIWYGFWFYDGWIPLKEHFNLLRAYNFSRFHWLHPLLWYLILAFALKIIATNSKPGKLLVVALILLQTGYLFYNSEEIVQRKVGEPSYQAFYAEEMFTDIKNYIGENQQDYRVVSIGIHPSISLYNGFYTLDGYCSNYDLTYKHEFRKAMAKELDKSPFYRNYFDTLGGSRCYLFVEKLMYNSMMTKDHDIVIEQLDLDTAQLKAMGGEYIFSALEICNSQEIHLDLLNVFENDKSAWRIYLYKIL